MSPRSWSQIATDILAQKYFRKRGVPRPDGTMGGETDARQVFHRLAFTWTDWGRRYGYFTTERGRRRPSTDELACMLARQMGAPNSPQWFNTGLFAVYGMKGPAQGHYFVNPETGEVEKATSAYERPQPHACFILSIEDDLVNEGGIMDLITREARLFKYGSGTGTNYSKLRSHERAAVRRRGLLGAAVVPQGERQVGLLDQERRHHPARRAHGDPRRRPPRRVPLHRLEGPGGAQGRRDGGGSRVLQQAHPAHAGGLQALARATGTAASSIPSRTGSWSAPSARRIQDEVPPSWVLQAIQLAEQGVWDFEPEEYTTDWDSEAYNTVSGQSSNNSLRLTDAFMKAVIDDGSWDLVNRTDGEPRESA